MKNFIVGLKGHELSKEEVQFLNKEQPLGIILFARNCDSPKQVQNLIEQVKSELKHQYPLVLIDQEGGRVNRLNKGFIENTPPPSYFGQIMENESEEIAQNSLYDNYYKIGKVLRENGINVNCAPVADLTFKGAHSVIGDRSFGSDSMLVTKLCKTVDKALCDSGVQSVIKHIPGHGRAKADTHLNIAKVHEPVEVLEKTDFSVFKELNNIKMAMTAHVIFTALDQKCATISKKVINYIRESIGYKGILLTDDLNMKALTGSISENIKKALEAGCDIAIHCNGDIGEMKEVASCCNFIEDKLLEKIAQLNCFS